MLTIILVISYIIITKIISLYAFKTSKETVEDYFVLSRTVGYLTLVASTVATTVNALSITGVPALVYKNGILALQMFAVLIIFPIIMITFGPIINRYGKEHGLLTQGSFYGSYYNSRLIRILVALIGLASVFPFLTIQISAIGKVFSVISNNSISYELSIVITMILIGSYIYFGGARAVILTDVFQGICLFIILILTAYLFTHWNGGIISSIDRLIKLMPEKLILNNKNSPKLVEFILSWPFAFILWPQIFQRFFMAKDEKTVKKTGIICFFIFFVLVISITFIGIGASAALYPNLEDPDSLVAEMYKKFWPSGIAIILIAVITTGMSTIDSILLTLSSLIVKDLTPLVSKKSSKTSLKESKRYSVIILVLACGLSISEIGRGAMQPLVTFGGSLAAVLFWPTVELKFKNKYSRIIVLTTICIGLTTILFHPLIGTRLININFRTPTLSFLIMTATYGLLKTITTLSFSNAMQK